MGTIAVRQPQRKSPESGSSLPWVTGMDAAAFPAVPNAGFTRQMAVVNELMQPHPLSHAELARKYGFKSATSIARLAHGQARLDGGAGRPTLLHPTSEKHIIEQMGEIVKQGGIVTRQVVEDLFAAAYFAEHNAPPPHAMESHYLQRLARRHHQRISYGPVTAVEARREQAQTRSALNSSMQSLKYNFNLCFPEGLEPDLVFYADETSVQPSIDWTAGVRGLRVRNLRSKHAVDVTTDITSLCFFNGSAEVLLHTIVLPGEPLFNKDAIGPLARMPNVSLMWTPSGRIQGDQDGIGSWHAAISKFLECVESRHGRWSQENGYRFALFVDGAKAHLDQAAIAALDQAGVKVFKLPPNLTHLIQVPDNEHVFGKLKENLRKLVVALHEQFKKVPIETYLAEAHKAVVGTLTLPAVARAIKDCGFAIDDKGRVNISDDTIRACLDAWVARGKVFASELAGPEDGMALRNRYVTDLQHFVAEGVASGALPPDTREWVNPAVVEATAKVSSQVPTRARRAQSALSMALRSGQHRVHVPASACATGTRRGTVVLNDLLSLAPQQGSASTAVAAAGVPDHPQRAETIQHLLASEPDKKRALEKALPNVNLEDVRAPVLKYLRGKRNLDWAIARAGAVLAEQSRNRAKIAKHDA